MSEYCYRMRAHLRLFFPSGDLKPCIHWRKHHYKEKKWIADIEVTTGMTYSPIFSNNLKFSNPLYVGIWDLASRSSCTICSAASRSRCRCSCSCSGCLGGCWAGAGWVRVGDGSDDCDSSRCWLLWCFPCRIRSMNWQKGCYRGSKETTIHRTHFWKRQQHPQMACCVIRRMEEIRRSS